MAETTEDKMVHADAATAADAGAVTLSLVERLRAFSATDFAIDIEFEREFGVKSLASEAADEIERLRSQGGAPQGDGTELVHSTVQGSGAVNDPGCQLRPIETAPQDGREVLACVAGCAAPAIARWVAVPRGGKWVAADPDDFEDGNEWADYVADHEFPATHWMPRPSPPGQDDRTDDSSSKARLPDDFERLSRAIMRADEFEKADCDFLCQQLGLPIDGPHRPHIECFRQQTWSVACQSGFAEAQLAALPRKDVEGAVLEDVSTFLGHWREVVARADGHDLIANANTVQRLLSVVSAERSRVIEGGAPEGFADQVWGLSILAQAELDNGDADDAAKTLVRIAEAASAAKLSGAPQPPTSHGATESMLIAAYTRGWRSCEECEGDDRLLAKAAYDYADKALSAAPPPPAQGGGHG